MKKLIVIDDVMTSFVSATGCAFFEALTDLLGLPDLLGIVLSFAFSFWLGDVISAIVYRKEIQEKPAYRLITFVVCILVFVIGHAVFVAWTGSSLVSYLEEELQFAIAIPVLSFVANLIVRAYHAKQIRDVYGEGEEGFVFDVDERDLEELNEQNQPVTETSESDADCTVKTRTGVFVGEPEEKGVSYLGIPYAKAPVGELRWKAPEPLPTSDAVFEAKNFGASAIQVDHRGSFLQEHRQSEDCLTLNVFVGDREPGQGRPVLVLFHHGDFTYGGSADPLLYGASFVSEHPDVLFVTFNYRLGMFGFINLSEVPGAGDYPDAANLGLLDQVAALRWIKENIAAFGGDPDKITVMGFESGATSICALAATGQAQGLFQRAFVFNGNTESPLGASVADIELARRLLEETQATTMEELLQTDADTLKDLGLRLWKYMYAPTYDGAWIPSDVASAFQNGAASGIEFVIGIPDSELPAIWAVLGDDNFELLIDDAIERLQAERGRDQPDDPVTDAVDAYIERETAATSESEAYVNFAEQLNTLYLYRNAASLAAGGNTVRLMYWGEEPLIENLGSGTINAAAALLGNGDASRLYGDLTDKDLGEVLRALLKKFVAGDSLDLYNNEIAGVDALVWEPFPQALVVADSVIHCESIADKLTDIPGLFEAVMD